MKRSRSGRLIAAMAALALAVALIPSAVLQAKGELWLHPGDGWHYLDGTDVKVQVEGDVIRIKGSGEIPDYDYWSLDERPWAKTTCHYLMVDDTITYLGKYAFYGMSDLKYITMSTKTFIADSTTFEKISYKPIYRLTGEEETTRMIGTIPFTSYDSIKRNAQINYNGACYILDSDAIARRFQESTNPTIPNVFNAGDTGAPWNDLENNENGQVVKPVCKITTPGVSSSYGVAVQQRYQGDACYQAYAAFIGDYTFATAYSITLLNGKEEVTYTDTALQYTLTIPNQFRYPGRTFRLLAIGRGVVDIYDDIDTTDATITFVTDRPTTAYALVYK